MSKKNDKRVTNNEDIPLPEHGNLSLLTLVGVETKSQQEILRELSEQEQPITVQDWYREMGMLPQPE
jgi:hypothetical protein